MDNTTVFTINQLAERWQCNPNQLYIMLREGKLTAFRIGGLVRVSGAEVERIETTPYEVNTHKTQRNRRTKV